MLSYYNSVVDDDIIYSVDMLRLSFEFSNTQMSLFQKFIDCLTLCQNCQYHIYNYFSTSQCKFRNLLTISNPFFKDVSFSVGLGFNGFKSSDNKKCFIEFNPNKIFSTCFDWFKKIFMFFYDNNINLYFVRFDFAIDLKIKRNFVHLFKDSRIYKLIQNNSVDNFTEYLGSHNQNGFVKIYNKTIESCLDYDLTRVEITLDSYSYSNFLSSLPKICFLKNLSVFDFSSFSQSDIAILQLLLTQDRPLFYLSFFGRDKKDKFKNIVSNFVDLSINQFIFDKIIKNIQKIVDKTFLFV